MKIAPIFINSFYLISPIAKKVSLFQDSTQTTPAKKRYFSTSVIRNSRREENELHRAILKCYSLEAIEKILLQRIYFIDDQDENGNTPLMLAVSRPDTPEEIINFFIRRNADIQNIPNQSGDTVVQLAIKSGPEMVIRVNNALHRYRGFPKNFIEIPEKK